LLCVVALAFLGSGTAQAKKKKHKKSKPSFAYYMLVLSYAPDFCAQPQGDKDPRECGTGRHVSFVVHGLWPQGETTRGPENCGSSPVSQSIVALMLPYIPTESLIQHEWKAHGSWSGLGADDYFALARKARDSVSIPDSFKGPNQQFEISPDDFAAAFASAHPSYPAEAFRASCYPSLDLQEARICQGLSTARVRPERRPMFGEQDESAAGSLDSEPQFFAI